MAIPEWRPGGQAEQAAQVRRVLDTRGSHLEQLDGPELRLKIFPVVLGAGERLFRRTSDRKPMRLVDIQVVEDGVVVATYEPIKAA